MVLRKLVHRLHNVFNGSSLRPHRVVSFFSLSSRQTIKFPDHDRPRLTRAQAALTLMPARFDATYIGVYENLNIVIDVHPA
jgi:hypothetical protein